MKFYSLDTETLNRRGGGHAILIGFHSAPQFLETPKSFSEIFDYLEGKKYVCWNMDFDFRAIFHKRFIPVKTLERLGFLGWTLWGDFEVIYIPRKYFKIKNLKTKKSFELFDLKQFYDLSLEAASKKFLPESGQKTKLPESWYNEIDRCLRDERRPKILAYFSLDISACQSLLDKILRSYSLIAINPFALYSAGFLAFKKFQSIFKGERLVDAENQIFKRSFFGGRVEFLKLGNFDHVNLYDLHSAYPWVISDLISSKGARIKTENNTWVDRGFCYGNYRILVHIPDKFLIGPLATRLKSGKIIYPIGDFETYCGYPGIKTLLKFKIKFEVLESYEIIPDCPDKIFGNQIEELYLERKKPDFDISCKKTLNSIYGKFAEKGQYNQKMAQLLAGRKIPPPARYGRGTNYAIAGHITETIRMRLWETAQAVGEKNVLGFATDGLFCEKTVKLKCGGKMGQWGLDRLDDFTVLGCGRYVWQAENKTRSKFRGSELPPDLILKLKKLNKSKISIKKLKTKTLRRWAEHPDEDLNVLDFEEKIFALEDEKRIWPEIKSFRDIFCKNYISFPLTLDSKDGNV